MSFGGRDPNPTAGNQLAEMVPVDRIIAQWREYLAAARSHRVLVLQPVRPTARAADDGLRLEDGVEPDALHGAAAGRRQRDGGRVLSVVVRPHGRGVAWAHLLISASDGRIQSSAGGEPARRCDVWMGGGGGGGGLGAANAATPRLVTWLAKQSVS